MSYSFFESSSVLPEELGVLLAAVGWGDHSLEQLERSIRAYTFIAHARTNAGALIGYVSAFSDGAASTMLGELIVHPEHQRRRVAAELLARVEARFPGVPLYIKALGEAKHFFLACGYEVPRTEMTVLFKKPTTATFAS